MRHARVRSLLEAYVDGRLPPALTMEVDAHIRSCAGCAKRAEAARGLSRILEKEPAVKAPAGVLESVMDAVYREAMKGPAEPLARVIPAAGGLYRRLGLSFVLTAVLLTASLVVPSLSYPRLLGSGFVKTDLEAGKQGVVKNLLDGADSVGRGILGLGGQGGK